MHQTFYIDIDEEITSIVDRLKKSKAREVIIVVPKRALLVQSIVNLKLLKKESDKLEKQISIVTQDKLGKMLIEKVGINVEEKLDDIESEEVSEANTEEDDERVFISNAEYDMPKNDLKNRLDRLGSDSYFDHDSNEDENPHAEKISKFKEESRIDDDAEGMPSGLPQESSDGIEKILNKELVTEIGGDIEKMVKSKKTVRPGKPTFDIIRNTDAEKDNSPAMDAMNKNSSEKNAFSYDEYEKLTIEDENRKKEAIRDQNNRIGSFKKDDVVDNFFQHKDFSREGNAFEKKNHGEIELSHGMWKYFAAIGVVVVVLVVLVGGYIFLPRVDISLALKSKEQSFDAQIKGSQTATGTSSDTIASKLVLIEDEFTGTYLASGSKSSASQKAKGTITIYNEYSSASQPLIASTRFETTDGKIFRLTQGVVVPGTSNSGGETKPGVIEAAVVADSAGSEYNIGANTFSIPGFKDSGTEKYSKFYAKSSQSMTGGGSSGSMVNSISSTDIANAKAKALEELTGSVKEKIKNTSSGNSVVLDDAFNIGSVNFVVSNLEGDVVSDFTVTAKTKASVVVFDEQDLKKALVAKAISDGKSDGEIDQESLVLQYGKSDADFVKGDVLIRVHASGKITSKIDKENLKKGILGKSEGDFEAYIKIYPDVESVEINYWPAFISGKIPVYENRVNITLDNK